MGERRAAGTKGLGMVSQQDLLETARDLAGVSVGLSPSQANLRRAVSTTYYALFHCMAENCADMLVGVPGSGQSRPAWHQAYRALEHGRAKQRSGQDTIYKFPVEIVDFAKWFAAMQDRRQTADYDPSASFTQSGVIEDIDLAELRIAQFRQAPERDRRAFAAYVLMPLRNQ